MKRIILSLLIIYFLSLQPAQAYWIWTPKTGKWVNPKNLPKDNPGEQFAFAKSFFDVHKYEDAKREFRKLLKAFPKSAEAAESQYYLGLTEEKQGKYYEAYQAYQMVIDKYPFSERIQEIIELEYKIAERFMSGEKRKALGVNPQQLFDIGFQLSFVSVLAIIYLYPKLKVLVRLELCKITVLRFIMEGCLVSLSAWLGTMLIIAWNFRLVVPVTVLANILIVPLAALITLCGFVLVLSGGFCPGLAGIFSLPTAALINLLLNINAALIKLPFAYIYF